MFRFMKILSWLTLIFLFMCTSSYALKYSKKTYSPNSYKERVLFEKKTLIQSLEEIELRIDEIEMDLLKLKADQEWLLLSIMRVEVQSKRVPLNMIKSKQALEEKRISLINEKNELQKKIRPIIIQLIALHNDVIKQYSGIPFWWEMPQEIIMAFAELEKTVKPTVTPRKTKKSIPVKPAKPAKPAAKKPTTTDKTKKINSIKNSIKKHGLSDWVEFVDSKWGMRVETRLPILFASGKSIVSDEYGSFFKKLAAFIKEFNVTITVEGFTDKTKVKDGNLAANFEIGAQRAVSVVAELLKYKVNSKIITAKTRGQHGIYIAGNSKRSRALSRRVQITIYFKK